MKFFQLATILAIGAIGQTEATVGVACADEDDSECGPGECCGVAKPASGSTATRDIKVCNEQALTTYVNANDANKYYDFECIPDTGLAPEDGANHLTV